MKEKLKIVQTDKSINFTFLFNKKFEPKHLHLLDGYKTIVINIDKKDNEYQCNIHYSKLVKDFSSRISFKISGIYTNQNKKIEKTILLGNFKSFSYEKFKLVRVNSYNLYPYITIKNNFAIHISKSIDYTDNIKVNLKTEIVNIESKASSIILDGNIKAFSNRIESMYVILKGRKSRDIFESKVKVKEKRDKQQNFIYTFSKEIFFSNFELNEDIYDLYFGFNLPGFKYKVERRIGKIPYKLRKKVKTLKLPHDVLTFINPYFTFTGKNISFTVEKVDSKIFDYYMKIKNNRTKDIWLVGEQPFKAQDTGYHFFKYMRKNFPDKKVYYVIDFNSREYENVKNLGNVVDYRSKEHFEVLSKTSHLIASHHPYYLLPLTYPAFENSIKAKKIFIQHGVFGTKNISNLYSKSTQGFDVDMFIVSSEKEKRYAIDDLEYLEDEVKVTGLSRFDELFAKDIPIKKQILIIPTWRDWLQNYDSFVKSEYYERYKSLLESKHLKKICKENNLDIVFCLHPNMQKFVDLFQLDDIKVVNQGEVNVQHLLKESILMVTDYSSVGFDFSFLDKPVIYYQFDTKRFLGKLPSHLDINEDLPGDIVRSESSLVELIQEYIKKDFKISDVNRIKASEYLKYKDRNNCKRIKEEIENFNIKKHPIDKLLKSECVIEKYNNFRKSKYYFPIMKKLYKIFKLLPMKNRVVFESGLGVQYADAPRYIFEELLSKYPDKEYIWIKNSKIYNMPKNVKIVERLSLKYYYYLATSKYWVNNQNFPYYITRRRNGVYLQTWHGTPLKKMLFDIENIHGRDEGYIERVEKAKKQWSYLLSQSEYATEKFRSAFRYDGEILELGYSRNDILVNHANDISYIKKIKKNLNLPNDKKVILYAPTFRDNEKKVGNKFKMSLKIDFDKFVKELSSDYILLLRLHVLVKENTNIPEEYKEYIIDASDYSDIQELYLISDILITDYSSVFFDYANLQRPIIFYAYDLDEYRDNLRGFYMDYDNEVPGPIVDTEEKLYHTIKNIDNYNMVYREKYKFFRKKYLPKDDGKATERVVNYIFKFSDKE